VGKGQNNERQKQVNNAYDVFDFDPGYLKNRKRLFDCLKQVSRGLKPNITLANANLAQVCKLFFFQPKQNDLCL